MSIVRNAVIFMSLVRWLDSCPVMAAGSPQDSRSDACLSTMTPLVAGASVQGLIRGLYESIPAVNQLATPELTMETIEVTPGAFSTNLTSQAPDGTLVKGTVARTINLQKKHILFSEAVLVPLHGTRRIPAFVRVPGVMDLVPGRGVPTVAFVTLQQMRLAGLARGGLAEASTDTIDNGQTRLELAAEPEAVAWARSHPGQRLPEKLIADKFWMTQTGRYLETILTQTGHRVTRTEVHYKYPNRSAWYVQIGLEALP